eukprot:399101-Lingulodinium_polyedra.AAC.1
MPIGVLRTWLIVTWNERGRTMQSMIFRCSRLKRMDLGQGVPLALISEALGLLRAYLARAPSCPACPACPGPQRASSPSCPA